MDYEINLARTLDCGQAFRWTADETGLWHGEACGRKLSVRQDSLEFIKSDPFWRHYFDFDFDYAAACRELALVSPVMEKACAFSRGIQILNQDRWEALCSFVISQNNNIKRIKLIISRLCNGGCFPSPEALLEIGVDGLRAMGLGFRDRYVYDLARRVHEGTLNLDEVASLPVGDAKDLLKTVDGIGDKVADCALLFGFHRMECFPMDVWMKRVMADLFDNRDGRALFGPLAGLAQQYLFFYARCCVYAPSGAGR